MKKKTKITIILLAIIGIILIITSLIYVYLFSPVDKKSKTKIEVVVEPGMTSKEIAKLLEKREIIKSSKFFLIYLKFNKCKSLKASTYDFSKSMNLEEVVNTLCEGNAINNNNLRVTFKEGKRVTDYATLISKEFGIDYNEVISTINDKTYLEELIKDYWFLTDDILNENIYYPLEGYLAPDTYEFSKESSTKDIIEVLLDQTANILKDYKKIIDESNKSVHEYLTMASLAELEGLTSKDRKMIIGVFYNRLNVRMNLGSDVTTYYAFQKAMTSDLTAKEFATSNPYNTRASNMAGKLPVGPICNVSKTSIEASITPTPSKYLYFVADKNGKIYYNTTNEDHVKTIKEIKEAGNWIW
ncbi:MAG: endolytic transglycosylase MltG [Bacilli bacterium]|nr:endolytic transglycosylase MltG [Bacilli bacterium]